MNRSTVNQAIADAELMFIKSGWHLPPESKCDVTGFGLWDFNNFSLVLINGRFSVIIEGQLPFVKPVNNKQ